MTTKISPADLLDELANFYGSEHLYRWSPLTKSVLTDGCKYLADAAGAYWLFDAIDSHLAAQGLNENTEFVKATLRRTPGSQADDAELVLDDGNGTIWMTQHIPFTDFPLPHFDTYAVWNGSGWTHMLPSEY